MPMINVRFPSSKVRLPVFHWKTALMRQILNDTEGVSWNKVGGKAQRRRPPNKDLTGGPRPHPETNRRGEGPRARSRWVFCLFFTGFLTTTGLF